MTAEPPTTSNLAAAKARLQTATAPSSRRSAYLELLKTLSSQDAALLAEEFPIGPEYDWALERVVEKFINEDLPAGIAWLQALPDEASNNRAFSAFGRLFAEKDISQAAALGSQITNPLKRQKFLALMVNVWARSDLNAAAQWVEQNVGLFLSKDLAYQGLLTAAPKEYALDHLHLIQNEGIRDATRRGFDPTPAAPAPSQNTAASTTLEKPPSPSLEEAQFAKWVRNEPVAASEWLAVQPASEQRDRQVAQLIESITFRQPKEAFAWALTITNGANRRETLRNVVSAQTGESLLNEINQAALPDEVKQELRELGAR